MSRYTVIMQSPCSVEDLDGLLTDGMVMGIPMQSLIETVLMGIINNDVGYRYMVWLERQLVNPDPVTVMYFHYNGEQPENVYNETFLLLLAFLKRATRTLLFHNVICVDVKVTELNEETMVVKYEFCNAERYDPEVFWRHAF